MHPLLVPDHLSHPCLAPSSPEGQNSRSGRNYLDDMGNLGLWRPQSKASFSAHKGTLSLCSELGRSGHTAADTCSERERPTWNDVHSYFSWVCTLR